MGKSAALAAIAVALTGCASNPGVAPLGPDTYSVTRQAATGFSGLGSLKVKALRQADTFCKKQGRVLRVLQTNESQPPYVLGNFPRAEVEFMCLAPGDSELTRPKP